ncbi:SSU ribosomal protein S7p (S5e), mitochondrial [Paraburkholderia tropica]|nr:SSU ribosomal protein S7p (S5e), mitochondrial [Paraburkholderia tropica]
MKKPRRSRRFSKRSTTLARTSRPKALFLFGPRAPILRAGGPRGRTPVKPLTPAAPVAGHLPVN